MKTMRIVAALLCLTLLPMVGYCDADDYKYAISNSGIRITSYNGSSDAEIPSEIDGIAVINIGPQAFKENKSVESVEIPTSVTRIEREAFASCSELEDIEFSEGLQYLGESAFYYCRKLDGRIVLPESLLIMGCKAFYYSAISSIMTGPNLSIIQYGTFNECSDLTEVYISPGTVAILGNNESSSYGTFSECEKLSKIVIPETVIEIGQNTFKNSPRVTIVCPSGSYAEAFAKENWLAVDTESYGECLEKLQKAYPSLKETEVVPEKEGAIEAVPAA